MVASNLEAARDCRVILLSVKPQTLTKVGHELGGAPPGPEQLVVSIVAGANCNVTQPISSTTARSCGACRTHRPRSRRGVTVWYAHAGSDRTPVRQARGLLRALVRISSDRGPSASSRWPSAGQPAPAPPYVFLVMEALIDAAGSPRLPAARRPRSGGRDAGGQHRLCQGHGPASGGPAQHGHSPGGTSAAAIHELEVRQAPDGPVRGGLGPRTGGPSNWAQSSKKARAERRPGAGAHRRKANNGARPRGSTRAAFWPLTWPRQSNPAPPARLAACWRSLPTRRRELRRRRSHGPCGRGRESRLGPLRNERRPGRASREVGSRPLPLDPEIRREEFGLRLQGARGRRADLPGLSRLRHGRLGCARGFVESGLPMTRWSSESWP